MTWLLAILLSLSVLSNDSIDLNTADQRLLETIPGIGQVSASAIVEHRRLFGPFFHLSELDYVTGIGEGTLRTLEEHLFIDPDVRTGPDTVHWLQRVDSLSPLLEVCFLDVGQGDAVLVRTDGGKTLLFDGGPDAGGALEPAVVFRLRELGVDRIDILAFSHPHADHIGGLAAVLRNFPVGKVLDPGMLFSSWVYEDLLNAVAECECGYGLLSDGMEICLSPEVLVTVESRGVAGTDLDLNENSALLRITCGGFSALLTGDIEERTEMLLTPAALPVTVLKVPHHGSLSSVFPPFLRRLAPQAAVFSAGRRNRFGHPHPAVVEMYRDMGCAILRTDERGTIVVQSDGEIFSISTVTAEYRPGNDFEH